MANGFGQTTYGANGGGAVLSVNGVVNSIPGGATIDWTTALTAATETTLADGRIIPAGVRYLPFGLIMAKITSGGKYGPHQSGVADGRQTLTKGSCFLLNQTIVETDSQSEYASGAIDGGRIWSTRLKNLNAGGTAYAAHTVDSTFNLAFPQISFGEH
jgi:hypothetical protein